MPWMTPSRGCSTLTRRCCSGEKNTLVGLATAAACCLVGGAGGGLPLEAGHENNGSAGCAEQRTGRAVCVGVEPRQPALFAGVYGDLRGGGYRGSYRPEEYPPRCGAWLSGLGRCVPLEQVLHGQARTELAADAAFPRGIDGYKHKHNTNILIVGGSGAGKTRTYGVPNVLECACSMVITDPKSEILRKTGNLLKQKGYEVLVFDLINPAASFCYNPFVYVHDDREVLTLIENLIQNTTPSHSKAATHSGKV